MVSGALAPPEMMKAIAWSTVQSVGVSLATGTISRYPEVGFGVVGT